MKKPCDLCGKEISCIGSRKYCTDCGKTIIKARLFLYAAKNKDSIKKTQEKYILNRDPRTTMLIAARYRAKRKGMEFTLVAEDVPIPEFCPIFGIPLVCKTGSPGANDNSPSLDRIDNSVGYIPSNVIVVSNKANRLKGDATLEDLKLMVTFYEGMENGKRNL